MTSNPILKNIRNIFFYALIWLFISAIYFTLMYLRNNQSLQMLITDSLVFNISLALLGLGSWHAARYLNTEDTNLVKIIFSHFAGGFFASVIWLVSGFIVVELFKFEAYNSYFWSTITYRFIYGVFAYYIITSFYYLAIYNKNLQEKITREIELKNLVTEAEIRSLKFQINPHFIFNSLNSMSALTSIDPDRARSMILKLADFLRYTLSTNDRQKNKLSEELKNIKLYLEIEKIRFEDKFDFEEDISECCNDFPVPNMILQPLFENAIKHAVYETIDKVVLKLTCRPVDNYLLVTLENNFEPTNKTSRKGAGVGLSNIKKRLELIYGKTDLMDVKKEGNMFKVELKFPSDLQIA